MSAIGRRNIVKQRMHIIVLIATNGLSLHAKILIAMPVIIDLKPQCLQKLRNGRAFRGKKGNNEQRNK
jgi:hypothetical protein